jgi:hypothetical protein|tara:strand:- start:55 stop:294 length:240 start_codon:yes stop_codon:yes gene_type:complete
MENKNFNYKTVNDIKDFDADNWADEKWVALTLNIKPNTLRKQRSKNINFLPYYKFGGRIRYNKLEVYDAMKKRRRASND